VANTVVMLRAAGGILLFVCAVFSSFCLLFRYEPSTTKTSITTDCRNTIVCIFDQRSPKITAFHIHEWIHDTLQLEEDEV